MVGHQLLVVRVTAKVQNFVPSKVSSVSFAILLATTYSPLSYDFLEGEAAISG